MGDETKRQPIETRKEQSVACNEDDLGKRARVIKDNERVQCRVEP